MPKTIQFIKSAVLAKDYPVHNMAEVAIAGRSNAGKSSFINGLAKRIIAKVSSTPGKTRLLNFFNMEDSYVLTDMPGYGFAARSGDEQREWHQMIETYLTSRENLRGLILVMDIRRSWTEDEEIMRRFSEREGFPIVVVLAKADKLSHSAKLQAIAKIKKVTGLSAVFATSATKKEGAAEVERYIFENWIKE
ncbi:ribosome biogenesis GTP-binding protein YihA/YsxC [Bdellovibrio svalbardensis]|uniref:Probable GTP-binding protein EngB n=1 Tax=Bdellovibrio svalbardensis TaxID=2972972 RepID=A0ABT6DIV9_9BACT|nr:ribosome biogenesis GTP-binding protein YihA/YsxC [Bdellovibrio svalbardensis]MDG0816777.1 ribosome biogenesis GTP-binding protein YihA/YsxC [Bdellovibrio svalbardensis]